LPARGSCDGQRVDHSRVASLKRQVVFTLISEIEVRPIELPERLRLLQQARNACLEFIEPVGITHPPPMQVSQVVIDLWKKERMPDTRRKPIRRLLGGSFKHRER